MKKLVIFYSSSGNTKFIAEEIATAIDADIMELKPKNDIPTKGIMNQIKAFIQVPELYPLTKKVDDYDAIFIGSPVWAWTYAPVLKTFFTNENICNKKIALFCCYGGSAGKTFMNMRKALKGNEIIGEIGFKDPLTKDKVNSSNRVREWAREIVLSPFDKYL